MEIDIDFIDSRKVSLIASPIKGLSRKVSAQEPATFEEAITATKFGKYNIILAFLAMIASLCAVFDTTTMSYTFVAAQCDLELSLSDKGLLNAVTYAGMISSAMIWGFLFDVLGRKKLLVLGYLVDAIFVFTSALSQSLPLLLVSKYLQGFIINGPFAALSCWISEFHCANYRPIYQMIIGSCTGLGTILLPLLAWQILPQNMDFTLINLDFHSWNVFLLITGLPAFVSGVLFSFFPESPKFLMTCGQNEKALEVLRKVYSINTGKPPETYPIRHLIDETKMSSQNKTVTKITPKRTTAQAFKEGFRQIKPIFLPPHLAKITLTCSVTFFLMMGNNMLRLWFPQIFQIMRDYQMTHVNETASLCTMLSHPSSVDESTGECFVNTDNDFVYVNSMITGTATMLGNVTAGILIRFLGKKNILVGCMVVAGVTSMSLYVADSATTAVALSALFLGNASVGCNVMVTVAVDLFPTTLRTMAIALAMMIGRLGAMSGNFLFPYLLAAGCEPPFFYVGGVLLVSAVIALFLPNTDMKALT